VVGVGFQRCSICGKGCEQSSKDRGKVFSGVLHGVAGLVQQTFFVLVVQLDRHRPQRREKKPTEIGMDTVEFQFKPVAGKRTRGSKNYNANDQRRFPHGDFYRYVVPQ
jgi:hypothetical protein